MIGSEPEILFYAQRRSATGYVYTYALMEDQPFARIMQEEMIREIVANEPEFVVFVNVTTSWLARPNSLRRIFEWFDEYKRGLELVARVELRREGARWVEGEALKRGRRRSPYWLELYRRPG